MFTEIEAKLKVDSHKEIIKRLTELGAEFLQEQVQTDFYFDDAEAGLTKADRCLRLRRQVVGDDERMFLTYKGAKQKHEFKKRQEVEIELKSGSSTEQLLSALGYKKILVFEKKRQLWRYSRCSIALDNLPLLGDFVEIEGPDDETITAVQMDLGLAQLSHIAKTYAVLMDEKLRKLGTEQREVLL
jgi:adenylate cyclase class 2